MLPLQIIGQSGNMRIQERQGLRKQPRTQASLSHTCQPRLTGIRANMPPSRTVFARRLLCNRTQRAALAPHSKGECAM